MGPELLMTMITGRTIKQGVGLVLGKNSNEYMAEVSVVEMCREDLVQLGVKEGSKLQLTTDQGSNQFICREADLPQGLLFIPFGPPANSLIGGDTGSTGMPDSKGILVRVKQL